MGHDDPANIGPPDDLQAVGDRPEGSLGPDRMTALYFQFFNEIGIIHQLATARLEENLPDGLLAPHFAVLNHLVRVADGRTPLQMARAFQVPTTTMSHQCRLLARHGLVRIAPNPEDGRSKCVWLTEAGRALRMRTLLGLSSLFEEWSADISPEEIADLTPRLSAIRAFLDAERDTPTCGGG